MQCCVQNVDQNTFAVTSCLRQPSDGVEMWQCKKTCKLSDDHNRSQMLTASTAVHIVMASSDTYIRQHTQPTSMTRKNTSAKASPAFVQVDDISNASARQLTAHHHAAITGQRHLLQQSALSPGMYQICSWSRNILVPNLVQ
jgi:hypothetical protein